MSTDDSELEMALDQALEGEPGAAELHLMRKALEQRLHTLERWKESEEDPDARRTLEQQVGRLREQIAALQEEETITQFVEDAVKFTMGQHRLREDMGF